MIKLNDVLDIANFQKKEEKSKQDKSLMNKELVLFDRAPPGTRFLFCLMIFYLIIVPVFSR